MSNTVSPHRNESWNGSRHAGYRYGLAVAIVLATVGIRFALDPLLGPNAPYMPIALAMVLVARFFGRGPALTAAALSVAAAEWFFVEPRHSFLISSPGAGGGLALFAIVAVYISLFVGHFQEALRAIAGAEARLRRQAQLINLSHDAVIVAGPDRVITGWNGGAAEMYGFPEADAVGKVTHNLLQTRDHLSSAEIDAALTREGRWDGELIHTASDGREIVTESRQILLRDPDGTPSGILEINRDISQRKRALDQLDEAHRKTLAILESISDGFNSFDREWRYTYVNAAAAKLVGKSREDLIGKKIWDVWPEAVDSPFGVAYRRAVNENVFVQVEEFFPPLNAWFEVRCYPSSEGLTLFFTDTTERRQTQERLRQAHKLESVGVLAGGVAHDFNNILTVVSGNASCALEQCPSCEFAQEILSASKRATHLTAQLLAYAGKGRAVLESVDVSEIVLRSRQLLSASVPARVIPNFNLSKNLPRIEADPSRLEQVIMNLVINAGESIPPKRDGRIQIATGCCSVTPEAARQHSSRYEVEQGRYVWLEVHDNGSGMDGATLARMFDPFFSTKFTGRGLGLAAVDGIVRSSKGFITVDTVAGSGTVVRVFFPAVGNLPVQVSPCAGQQPGRLTSTVLVVEDDSMVRKMVCTMLQRAGYEVLEAKSCQHALQVLDESPVLPSVGLFDLATPGTGEDELLPALAKQYPDLKIVVSSGYPEEEARRRSPNCPVAGYLLKPYTPSTLSDKITQVLAIH